MYFQSSVYTANTSPNVHQSAKDPQRQPRTHITHCSRFKYSLRGVTYFQRMLFNKDCNFKIVTCSLSEGSPGYKGQLWDNEVRGGGHRFD